MVWRAWVLFGCVGAVVGCGAVAAPPTGTTGTGKTAPANPAPTAGKADGERAARIAKLQRDVTATRELIRLSREGARLSRMLAAGCPADEPIRRSGYLADAAREDASAREYERELRTLIDELNRLGGTVPTGPVGAAPGAGGDIVVGYTPFPPYRPIDLSDLGSRGTQLPPITGY